MCPYHAHNNARTPWQPQPWVIPPQANAAWVWALADVLEVYTRPDDPRRPQVCLDETSQPWVADTCAPLPATPGPPTRGDEAEARQGPAHLWMVFEPLAGPRRVQGTARRTALDGAPVLQEWVDAQDPQAEQMVLVMDPRNPPKPASRYEAVAPAEARRVMARLESHETPTHGRGVDRAETELSVLATPWLDRRIPDPTTLTPAVAAWERHRNAAKCRVAWRFTTRHASITLKRLYPSIQLG